MSNKFYGGIYQGVVVDNKDPKKRNRLKIRVPNLHGSNEELPWALPGMSFGCTPPYPKGTTVWVMFQNGDPKFPVYLGYLIKSKN